MSVEPDSTERIDECLSIRGGALFIEECDAVELARRFGTPLYVVSENQLRRNARRFVAAFAGCWPEGEVRVLPSIKANLSLALRRVLTDEGLGCDVFGAGELEAAVRCAVPPDLISLNGAVKDRALLGRAVALGARVTLDSVAELEFVREAARAQGLRARVRFRLRPDMRVESASDFFGEPTPIGEAIRRYKPGIAFEDVLVAGRDALAAPELDVTGVMVHIGRHGADPAIWGEMVRALVALLARLRDAWKGWEPGEIDLGGGFPVPRDPTGRAFERRRDAGAAAPVEEYARVLTETLRAELARSGMTAEGKAIEVEPGRSLYGDAGIQLASVRHVKRERELTWIETDTSEVFLPDGALEHNRWTTVVATRAAEPAVQTADVVGLSCNFDIIVPDARLPEVEPGDVIAFLDTGAYQDAGASNFNALLRPATVLVRDGEARVVKRAETVEDVFRRDVETGLRRLDHVSVTSGDLERSLAFYRDLLGLPLADRSESEAAYIGEITGFPSARVARADLSLGDGQMLELLEYLSPAGKRIEQRTNDPGSTHISLRVEDIDATYERLVAAGITVRSPPVEIDEDGDWIGARSVYAVDPDGVTVELVQRP